MERHEKKNAYYLLVSGMQKAVRFGMPEVAVNLARVAHSLEPYRLYRRIWTVLFEDCGLNEVALNLFAAERGSYRDFDSISPLIAAMASGPKTHAVFGATMIIKGEPEELPPCTVEELRRTKCGQELLTLRDKWKRAELFEYYEGMEFPRRDGGKWVVELVRRSMATDYEKWGLSVPLFFAVQGAVERVNREAIEDQTLNTELFNGFYPFAALDEHTWPGKMMISALRKQMGFPSEWFGVHGNRELWLEWIIFGLEGSAHKDELLWPPPLWRIALSGCGYAWLFESRVREWLISCLPKMRELRLWAMSKCSDLFAEMEKLYRTDSVEVEL